MCKGKKGIYDESRKGKKMSFDVNVLSTKPIIKPASSMQNDGGSGNLGYMSQGRKKKDEKEKKYLDESVFLKKEEKDIFGFDRDIEVPEEKSALNEMFNKVKKYFSR